MYEMQGAVCRVLFWGPMKVTLQNKTWISKSTLNQKQEKKKKELPLGAVLLLISTTCLSLVKPKRERVDPGDEESHKQ